MLSIGSSIIFGVVSGIITSFFVWFFVKIFNKVVLPWYQNVIVYQGLKIDGFWVGFYEEGDTQNERDGSDPDYSIHIEQKAHNIKGTIVRNKNQDGTRDIKDFYFEGIFRNGDLVLFYTPKDKTRLGLGAYVMKLTDDGRTMEGNSLFAASNHNRGLSQFSIVWKRKSDSQAEDKGGSVNKGKF